MSELMDVAAQTAVIREVDAVFMEEGGTPRHWVQALHDAGYEIAPKGTQSRLNGTELRIIQALTAMDESMYGDAEAPFRMRARLTGRSLNNYQNTGDYIKEHA